jgi:hypothetical protein
MKYGSQTFVSYEMNWDVGTEKTSVLCVRDDSADKRRLLTIQFFKGELLGLTNEHEYHGPGNEIETSVEANYDVVR